MENGLSYRNEDDRCYGVTGMAVGILVFNGEDMLSSVCLDAEPHSMIEMEDMFYFNGNPGLSAKSAWNRIKANFDLSVAMLISNMMCRSMVLDHETIAPDKRKIVHDIVAEEGKETCGLDDDEINKIFDKEYTILFRVFNHQGVHSVVHDFADTLKRRRRMSRLEILEQLRALSLL
ncbi:MAG: hypothetical protein K2I18_01970 [Paramuribaculum sp.]|nr:hypothetical protein [Paramuribaculum sp.]